MPPTDWRSDDRVQFTSRLAALRTAYGVALPDQLGLLRAAARALAHAGNDSVTALEEIRAAAHKFAGSAPTFGFTAIGAGARALERQISSVLQAADPMTTDDVGAIQDAIEALIADARLAALPVTSRRGVGNAIVVIVQAAGPRSALVESLAQLGYTPILIDPAMDAEATLAGCVPRAILVQAEEGMDYLLPVLDRVRGAGFAETPVAFFARQGSFTARYAASRAGAAGFLVDPVGMPDLSDRLAAIIAPVSFQPYRVLYVGADAPALDPAMFLLCVEPDPTGMLRRLEDSRPELVLLSTALDGFDAVDLARVIWQEEAYRDVGIFFVSRDPAVHRAVAARGVTDTYFISRPMDVAALQGRITPYLHDRRAGLRPPNQVDLGPYLARLSGHIGTTLPLRAPAPIGIPASIGVPAPIGTGEKPRRKILIVDDDRYLVAMLAHALADSGADVVRAYSGDQGYAAAWQEQPSAIISDVEMPNGTGDQMMQKLRGNPRTRDIPVIVMTNRRWDEGKDYALEREMRGRLGAAAYLQKPVQPEVLVRELARL